MKGFFGGILIGVAVMFVLHHQTAMQVMHKPSEFPEAILPPEQHDAISQRRRALLAEKQHRHQHDPSRRREGESSIARFKERLQKIAQKSAAQQHPQASLDGHEVSTASDWGRSEQKMEHQVLSSFSTSFSQSVASKPSGGSKSSQPSSVGHKSSGKTSSSTNSKPNSKPKKGSTSSKNYNFLLNHKSNPLTKKKMGSHERQILERKQANTKITTYKSLGSSKGLSACLFIMDDSIRLMEWLAYHYTIMPLQYLVVGIDPHSKHPERVIRVLKRWQQLMDITILEDDQVYLSEVPYDKAWKRKYWIKPGVMNPLYRYKNSTEYRSQEHKRRQNIFTAYCFRQHFQQGRDWVMTLDSDEFLIFNYPGTDEHTNSSNFVKDFVKTNATVIRERQDALDIREHLPPLSQRITVADVLQQTALERCLRLPALNFTAHEGRLARRDSRLLTMRQTRTGPKEGRTTKVLLDLSRAQLQYLTWEKVVNVHNPNKRICGWNSVIGSGTDYIASIFRYHHYVAGSIESYLERSRDYRRSSSDLLHQFYYRNFEPVSKDNADIHDWLDWFIDKVGNERAKGLLFNPLEAAYKEMRSIVKQRLTPEQVQGMQAFLRRS